MLQTLERLRKYISTILSDEHNLNLVPAGEVQIFPHYFRKQPSACALQNFCSGKFHKIQR